MALAVTHVLLTILVLDLLRHYVFGKDKFPRYLLLIGGVAGLLPDIDIPFSWLYNLIMGTDVWFHGGPTHSILLPILFLGIALFFHMAKNMKWAKIFYVGAFGLIFHLFLDCMFGGYDYMLWPVSFFNFCPQFGIDSFMSGIDAIILLVWLLHEEIHHKIKDYF